MKRIAAFSSHEAEAIKREFPPIERSLAAVGRFQRPRFERAFGRSEVTFRGDEPVELPPQPGKRQGSRRHSQ